MNMRRPTLRPSVVDAPPEPTPRPRAPARRAAPPPPPPVESALTGRRGPEFRWTLSRLETWMLVMLVFASGWLIGLLVAYGVGPTVDLLRAISAFAWPAAATMMVPLFLRVLRHPATRIGRSLLPSAESQPAMPDDPVTPATARRTRPPTTTLPPAP